MSLANQREDFLLTLATFKAEKLEEYKQALSSLFPAEGNPFESDADKTSFLKSFLRNLRIFLEHQMEKATRDGSNLYTRDTHELLNFTFWSARRSYIDEINAFIVMEDIYDCLSMEEISAFFEFLEELVNLYGTFTQNQQQAMMRICNNILKKFSKVHDNDFRGRVQLVLSKITSVWEQTAVNLKSNLNLANSTSYSSTFGDEDSLASKQFKTKDFKELSNLRISFGLYMKFWELQKFLQNPALLLSDEASIILEDESALEPGNDLEVMEIENINGEALGKSSDNKDPKETKVTAFCRFASDIIDIFRKDPLLGPESMLRQKNYPKYLTKYSLLNIQLKDPSFRKSWLTQVIYCLWNLQNPLKLAQTAQKKGPEIKEADLEKVKALEKKVSEYIKEIPSLDGDSSSLNTQLQFFLEREKNWMQWKETGCKSFEKAIPDTLANFSKKLKDQTRLATEILDFQVNQAKNEVYPNYKEKEPYFNLIKNTSDKFLKDTGFDKDNSVFSFLHKPQLPQQIQALEPSANYYFNTFLSEMKDPTLTEEDKLSGDTTTVWRALRVLARNCINQFTTPGKTDIVELKLDDILKKMSKNEANPSEKPEGEGQPGEEKKKEEVKKDEVMKEVKEPSSAGLGDEKSEMKVEKEVKKDVKPVEKMVVEPKVIETKSGEHKEEKVIERHKEPITLSKSDSKTEKEKITERIKSKVSEGEKGAEKTIHLSTSNRKRSPENDVKEYEKQPPGTKKPKT